MAQHGKRQMESSELGQTSTVNVEPLAVTPKAAAKMLSIGQRTLARITAEGELPHFNIGRLVRYDVADIRAYIQTRKGGVSYLQLDPPAICPTCKVRCHHDGEAELASGLKVQYRECPECGHRMRCKVPGNG